jgi:hypothetical protein
MTEPQWQHAAALFYFLDALLMEKVVGAAAMVTNRDPRYRLSKEAVESAASQV